MSIYLLLPLCFAVRIFSWIHVEKSIEKSPSPICALPLLLPTEIVSYPSDLFQYGMFCHPSSNSISFWCKADFYQQHSYRLFTSAVFKNWKNNRVLDGASPQYTSMWNWFFPLSAKKGAGSLTYKRVLANSKVQKLLNGYYMSFYFLSKVTQRIAKYITIKHNRCDYSVRNLRSICSNKSTGVVMYIIMWW